MNLMKWSQGSEEASPAAAITTKRPKQRMRRGKEGEGEGKCYSLAKVRHELVVVFAFRSLQLVYRWVRFYFLFLPCCPFLLVFLPAGCNAMLSPANWMGFRPECIAPATTTTTARGTRTAATMGNIGKWSGRLFVPRAVGEFKTPMRSWLWLTSINSGVSYSELKFIANLWQIRLSLSSRAQKAEQSESKSNWNQARPHQAKTLSRTWKWGWEFKSNR